MAQQSDVFRTENGSYVLEVQADLFNDANTRVVARLGADNWSDRPLQILAPRIAMGDLTFRSNPLQLATLAFPKLVTKLGSAANQRDDIMRDCNLLTMGY
ncbi:CcdB family protein [Marivita sp. S2033]|uniref:CcdB family protein n=1 Tax=Marivita sp. S2033 TaxID=3373187 RepID=UPI003982B071